MQGHPEVYHLWERHAEFIIKKYGLTFTTHEPCLYSGVIEGNRVLFMQQVDNFVVATSSERTGNILFDYMDDELMVPLKRMGLIHILNGMCIKQTRDYINMPCNTYIERVCATHLTP